MKKAKILILIGMLSFMVASAFPAYAGPGMESNDTGCDETCIKPAMIRGTSTGWEEIDGKWYYLKNGHTKTGWIDVDGKDYYLKTDGTMACGECLVNGKCYTFDSDGALLFEGIHRDGMDDELITEAWESYESHQTEIQDMLQRVNQTRASVGEPPLVLDKDLSIVAMYRCLHMYKYNYYDHYANGERIVDSDYEHYAGKEIPLGETLFKASNPIRLNCENIVDNNVRAITGYINSPTHCEVLTYHDFNKVGVGLFMDPAKKYYNTAEVFGF